MLTQKQLECDLERFKDSIVRDYLNRVDDVMIEVISSDTRNILFFEILQDMYDEAFDKGTKVGKQREGERHLQHLIEEEAMKTAESSPQEELEDSSFFDATFDDKFLDQDIE